jgi:hypothetical protein
VSFLIVPIDEGRFDLYCSARSCCSRRSSRRGAHANPGGGRRLACRRNDTEDGPAVAPCQKPGAVDELG